jgi:phosphoribosylaminoimidazolecarboxamide formyltransferase/IMP cyclohydrolase
MRALISVYYKEGVEELAKALQELGYEIVSSSSTAKYLTERGLKVKEIERITNFPEIFGKDFASFHSRWNTHEGLGGRG